VENMLVDFEKVKVTITKQMSYLKKMAREAKKANLF